MHSNPPLTSPGARRALRILSRSIASATLAVASLLVVSDSVQAGSANWTGAGDNATWDLVTNWNPNNTFPNGIGDTATFNTGAASIVLGIPITVQNILFSGGAGAFTLGANGGNGFILRGTGTGSAGSLVTFNNSISMAAAAANAEVIAAPLTFVAPSSTSIGYAFRNDSGTAAATLTLSGTIETRTASNRFTSLLLDGSNPGDNIVNGVITSGAGTSSAGQGNVVLIKNGPGRWILSGANLLSGTGITNVAQGIHINAGTLSAQNNQAFGTTGTANANQVHINSGGTLELANAITLDNGVSLNLNSGGTITSSGSTTTNGRINVSTAASASVTISASGAADLFTVGSGGGTDDFTGGSSTSTVNVSGAGTVLLANASNYAGGIIIGNGSTLQINSDTALGAATSANLTLLGNGRLKIGSTALRNPTVAGLNSSSASSVIEAGFTATSTLIVNKAANTTDTYAGILQNGAGTLALTKSGLGTLNLTGTNTYTGATLVRGGMLNLDFTAATAPLPPAGIISSSSALTLGGGAGGASGSPAGLLRITGKDGTANSQTFSNLAIGAGANKVTLTPGTGAGSTADLTITNAITVPAGNTHGTLQFSATGTTILAGNLNAANFGNSAGLYATYGTDDYAATNGSGVVGAATYANVTTASAAGINNIQGDVTQATGAADPTALRFADATGRTFTNNDASYFMGSILVASTSGAATFTGQRIRSNGSAGDANRDFNIIQNSGNAFTMAAPLENNTTGRNMSFVKAGAGTVILTAANTYSNGTFINEGTIQVGAGVGGGTTGALGTGGVTNYGSLIFNRSDAISDGNLISGTGSLTKAGGGTTTLTGITSTFTGDVNVNAGVLAASTGNLFGTGAASALGAMNVARNIAVNNTGTLRFDAGDVFSGSGLTPAATLGINAGGTVTNNGASFNTLGAVGLNGGTLTGTGGSGNTEFQMYLLRGPVTVGGSAASTISGSGNATANYHLNGAIAFNVADATGSSATDLNASAAFLNGVGATPVAGGITKTGAGTMTLSGANAYTGPTVANGGALEISGSINASTSVNITAGTLSLTGTTSAGGASDRLKDTGALTLGGGRLQIANGFASGLNETLAH